MDQLVAQPHRFAQTSAVPGPATSSPASPSRLSSDMTEHLRAAQHAGRAQPVLHGPRLVPCEMGEQLPMFKPPVDVDAYPLRWTTPHKRWSIHSSWRDASSSCASSAAGRIVYLSPGEAAKRGLRG